MKNLLRRPFVQSMLAGLIIGYVRLVGATMRWRFDQSDAAAEALAEPEGGMLFFWHGKLMLAGVSRGMVAGREVKIMSSLSRDGQFGALIAKRLGFGTIWGSTARDSRQKGGAAAFMEAVDYIGQGNGVVITPDGPRGPSEVMPAGPVLLAKRAGSRVFLGGVAARPAIRLKTWDHLLIPLPFARGAAIMDGPLYAPADASRAELVAIQADWQARLDRLNQQAEAMLDEAAP